jgi:hypothetical protein
VAKSQLVRGHTLGFARLALVALAFISCGTLSGAGSGARGQALQPAPFCVAPVEGSPEEAAFANGDCSGSSWHVAPIEGSPEQTVADRGR